MGMTRDEKLQLVMDQIGGVDRLRQYISKFGIDSGVRLPSAAGEYLISTQPNASIEIAMYSRGRWLNADTHAEIAATVHIWLRMPSNHDKHRTPTTGRHATRKELTDAIWYDWMMTPLSITDIATNHRIGDVIVSSILSTKEGFPEKSDALWLRLEGAPPVREVPPARQAIIVIRDDSGQDVYHVALKDSIETKLNISNSILEALEFISLERLPFAEQHGIVDQRTHSH